MLDVDAECAFPGRVSGVVEKRERAVGESREPRCVCGRIEQRPAALGRRYEKSCAFERLRGDVVGAPLARAQAGLLERRRRVHVDADRREGEVPGAAVGVRVGKRVGEGSVRGAPGFR